MKRTLTTLLALIALVALSFTISSSQAADTGSTSSPVAVQVPTTDTPPAPDVTDAPAASPSTATSSPKPSASLAPNPPVVSPTQSSEPVADPSDEETPEDTAPTFCAEPDYCEDALPAEPASELYPHQEYMIADPATDDYQGVVYVTATEKLPRGLLYIELSDGSASILTDWDLTDDALTYRSGDDQVDTWEYPTRSFVFSHLGE